MAVSILAASGQDPRLYTDSFLTCKAKFYDKKLGKTIIYNPEVNPAFPGGPSAYMRYIHKEFRYQASSDLETMQTSAMADFIVDIDGSILQPKIVKKTETDSLTTFENAFLNFIKGMPKWVPGKCGKKPVAVIVRLPIILDIEYE